MLKRLLIAVLFATVIAAAWGMARAKDRQAQVIVPVGCPIFGSFSFIAKAFAQTIPCVGGIHIALSSTSIAAGSSNGTTLDTAAITGGATTGTPSWSLTDGTGTFEINSSTGVVTVLSNTDLTPGATFPITISVSGVAPTVSNAPFTIVSAYTGPCDILASAGTPCVAAHSVTRLMRTAYAGSSIFQIRRASDSTTHNIGTLANGTVNTSAITTFCSGTTCTYSEIYDQTGNSNNLPQATAANQAPVSYTTFSSGSLPMVATGAYQYYRNRASTSDIPTGNSSITEYDVVNTLNYGTCCGTYGDMESTVVDAGAGAMFALAFGTGEYPGGWGGTGSGPWSGVDWENGVFLAGPTVSASLQLTIGKYNSNSTTGSLQSDSGLTGALSTLTTSYPPSGYPAAFQGGLSLGEGGDGTPAPTAFMEGVIVAAATTPATDSALATNVHNFYSQFGSPTLPKQNFVISVGSNGAGGSGGSISMNPTLPIPAGSLIVVISYDASASVSSNTVTDSKSNTYTRITCETIQGNLCIYCAYNVTALTTSDTITFTTATQIYESITAMYAQNILTSSSPLDSAVTAIAGATSAGTVSVTSGTPSQSGDLFIGTASSSSSNPTAESIGWNDQSPGVENIGWLINLGTSPKTYAPTGGNSSGGWNAVVVGFKHN